MRQNQRMGHSLGVGGSRGDEGVGSLGKAPVEKQGAENSAEHLGDNVRNENGLGHPVGDDHGGADGCEQL